MAPRFFITPADVSENEIRVREDAHHIRHVLRMVPGEELTLCDGAGTDYFCRIAGFEEESVCCEILSVKPSESEPKTRITLFQGLPKSDKMEWIIEKGVETGISAFVPVQMNRSVSVLDARKDAKKAASRLQRWQKIALAASKQSGRGKIPEVLPVCSFREMLQQFESYDGVLVCYEDERMESLKKQLRMIAEVKPAAAETGLRIAVVIGPEGGLSPEEVGQMCEAGARVTGLGPRILRTETAGLVCAAQILYELEED